MTPRRRLHRRMNFYPRPPRGGRHDYDDLLAYCKQFLSTPSARRATSESAPLRTTFRFLSTPSARRATITRLLQILDRLYFYPRPPRGGRRLCISFWNRFGYFYPRPPRGGRRLTSKSGAGSTTISIHALREEGDEDAEAYRTRLSIFLSTPSARRATAATKGGGQAMLFLSTPSARRATAGCAGTVQRGAISIHALREEGDRVSGRRRTRLRTISIHALREEGDTRKASNISSTSYFYPRPPRGGRRSCAACGRISSVFLSTPSARRATSKTLRRERSFRFLSTPSARRATIRSYQATLGQQISIHALREEGDCDSRVQFGPQLISIHALREEGDMFLDEFDHIIKISIHALREEGDNVSAAAGNALTLFLSTPSARRATG